MPPLKSDTATIVAIHMDTVIKYDNHLDTVIQVRHDTMILIKTTYDTLLQHDTIVRTNTVVTRDTVYTYSLGVNYPVPASDSGQIYITFDTVPGFVLTDIQITNLLSYIPGTLTDQTPAQYTQVSDYVPINYPNYGWMIHPVGPMICNIVF